MALFSKNYEETLRNCSSEIINAIVNDIARNFHAWENEHPDANTVEIEKEIATIVWELLKVDDKLSSLVWQSQNLLEGDNTDEDGTEDVTND